MRWVYGLYKYFHSYSYLNMGITQILSIFDSFCVSSYCFAFVCIGLGMVLYTVHITHILVPYILLQNLIDIDVYVILTFYDTVVYKYLSITGRLCRFMRH